MILPDVKCLGDIAYIKGDAFNEVVGLANELPERFEDFREHPAHAWCVASFLKYEFEKAHAGWTVEIPNMVY